MRKQYLLLLTLTSNIVIAQIADFTVSTNSGCSPLVVSFTNKSSNSESYLWEFGDGTSISLIAQNSFLHEYTNFTSVPMNFIARLITYNSDSTVSDTATSLIQVYPKVISKFSMNIDSGCTPLNVPFKNLSSAGSTLFKWDFGDSTSSDYLNPSHIFFNESYNDKIFYVNLIAENQYSCTDSFKKSIKIYPKVKSDFSIDHSHGISPFEVNPINRSIGGVAYKWDFGDGDTSLVMNPSHLYYNTTLGDTIYPLLLVTFNVHKCTDSSFNSIKVSPQLTNPIENVLSKNKIYPIPVIDNLKIESKTYIEKIEIYNLQGILIYSININGLDQYNINLKNLKPDYYLIKISGKQFTDWQKIIKN